MKILGFNFTKISIERLQEKGEDLKINAKVDITEISKINPSFISAKGEDLLGVKFSYRVNYEPKFAKIEFLGNLIVSAEEKITKEVLKKWKDKKVPEDFNISILNVVLRKANIKALELEDSMNLPLHMPMQRLKKQ